MIFIEHIDEHVRVGNPNLLGYFWIIWASLGRRAGTIAVSSRGEQPQKLVFRMGGVDFRSATCQFFEAF